MTQRTYFGMETNLSRFAILLIYIITNTTCSTTSTTRALPADCAAHQETLNCAYSIPKQLQADISRVHIRNYKSVQISLNDGYDDWKNVVELDITIDHSLGLFDIPGYAFSALKNLKSLGIHARHVHSIDKFIFAGLDLLENLDLSGCMRLLLPEDIIPAIANANFTKLSSLNLTGVATSYSHNMVIDDSSLDMFIQKSVEALNLSGTNLYLKEWSTYRPLPIVVLDISNITLMTNNKLHKVLIRHFSKLNTLIANNNERYDMMHINYVNENFSTCNAKIVDSLQLPLEYVHTDKIASYPIVVKNCTLNVAKCPVRVFEHLKRVSFRYNQVQVLDLALVAPKNIIMELDISHNEMKYISPLFLRDLKSLKFLNLAYNNINHMEQTVEFGNLLENLRRLQNFNISHNYLTYIPYNLFIRNNKLTAVDLSWNDIEIVSFRVDHLAHLKYIYLNNNKIKSLSESFQMSFTALVHLQTDLPNPSIIEISMENNDFACSCENKHFLKWLIQYVSSTTNQIYSCKLEGEEKHINRGILEEVDYLCIRSAIIIGSVASSCFVIAIVAIGTVYVIRKRRRKLQQNLKRNYLDHFRQAKLYHGKSHVKYVAFLVHASADVVVATQTIYNQLDNTFREMAGVNSSTVCMGNKHFLPGFSIIEQTMQCLEQSCVAVVVISKFFCQSHWCEMELKEAYQQQKPIVLIFTEVIDEALMPPVLLNVFKRQTRAMLYYRDGQFVLEPSWDVLCEAVVTLAATHYQHH